MADGIAGYLQDVFTPSGSGGPDPYLLDKPVPASKPSPQATAQTPVPAPQEPISLLDAYRRLSPEDAAIKDDVILARMRLKMAPYVAADRFNTLARDPHGISQIEEEAKKPPTGLQAFRAAIPEAATLDDDTLLRHVYDRAGALKKIDPQLTSFDDFRDLMNPKPGAFNTAWHAWQTGLRASQESLHQWSGRLWDLPQAPQALDEVWGQFITKALDGVTPGTKVGSQAAMLRTAIGNWWTQHINDISTEQDPVIAGTEPGLTPKQWGDSWRQFVGWFAGMADAQKRQSAVDAARREQAQQLAQVTGGPMGGVAAKVSGVVGEQATNWALSTLVSAWPGMPLTSSSILAGAMAGSMGVTQAVQAHSDHALTEGMMDGGFGLAARYMWSSPNGWQLTALTNMLANTGEQNLEKWMRGEKIDPVEAMTGFTLDALTGVIAGRHQNENANFEALHAQRMAGISPDLLRLTYPETFTSGSVTAVLPEPEPVVPEPAKPQETPSPVNLERGFLTRAAPQEWAAAGDQFRKAVSARQAGDYQQAAQYMDGVFANLPRGERREIAKALIQYGKDATKPVQPIQVKTPEKPVQPVQGAQPVPEPVPISPQQARINDVVNNGILGLSPQRGEAGAAANPFGGRQYRYVYGQGLVPIEEGENVPRETTAEEIAAERAKLAETPEQRLARMGLGPMKEERGPETGTVMGLYGPSAMTYEELDRSIAKLKEIQREIPIDIEAVPVGEVPKALPAPIPKPVEDAYMRILPTQLGSAVKISELARESGMSVAETKKVVSDLAARGDATLDEGHWPTATDEDRAAAITQRGTPRLLVRFPRLADRSEAGFTLNWIAEMYDWVKEHMPSEERPWATSKWLSTFEPQHPSRGREAVIMHTVSVGRTAEAQQRRGAIPVEIARALEIDKVLRHGERVERRAGVFDRLSDAQQKEILIQGSEGLVKTGNTQVDWLMNSFHRPAYEAFRQAEVAHNFRVAPRKDYIYQALPREQRERYVQWNDEYFRSDPRWTKHRQLPNYRIVFLAGFRPVKMNPERLFQMRLASHVQAIREVRTLRDAELYDAAIRKDKLTPEQRAGYENNPDYTSLRAPNGEEYFLTHNARQVLENAWDTKSLFRDYTFSPLFKAFVTMKGIGARTLLSWSLQHPRHVATIHAASALVSLERRLLGPNRRAAFYDSYTEMMKNPRTTSRLLNRWRGMKPNDWTPDEEDVFQDVVKMGLAMNMSEEQRIGFVSWLREQFPRLPFAHKTKMAGDLAELGWKLYTTEHIQEFTFNHLVPSLKLSAAIFGRTKLYEQQPELLNGHNELARAKALVKLGTAIDMRFGEINYDNIYWTRVWKDIGQMSLLSPGWTMNTLQFIGGAVHDLSSNVVHMGELLKKIQGKPSEHQFLTDRLLYTINYSVAVMLSNALRQYIWTGLFTGQPQLPEDKDYVFPRLYKDEKGNWVRARPIEFVTETGIPWVAGGTWWHHVEESGGLSAPGIAGGTIAMAVNKINPFISTVVHDFQNKNYFGQELRSPLSPPTQQTREFLAYLLGDPLTPITVKTYLQNKNDWKGLISSFFGDPRASQWINRSATENRIEERFYREHPNLMTRESVDLRNAHTALAESVRNNDQTGITRNSAALAKLGESQKGISDTIRYAHKLRPVDLAQRHFKALNPIEQQEIIAGMTLQERKIYLPLAKPGVKKQLEYSPTP